ncbi:MAG: helix-turn-helix domain-containing protein [Actinobacteria bacterium]|nr:helix-turn-helix domain-containing protein [Actinomycetota bacterium]
MLTVPEAAKRVGRDPETVRRWIRSGKLPSKRVGTQHLVDEHDLAALVDGSDSLPLPEEWRYMSDGRPQPDWVRLVRDSRESH